MSMIDTIAQGAVNVFDVIQHRIPPGPGFIPLNWIINTQKFGCWIFVFSLMIYYDNWSIGAWMYLFLHGSYGITWFIKDLVFPDESFQKRVTFFSAIASCILLISYLLPGYQMVARIAKNKPTEDRIIASSV